MFVLDDVGIVLEVLEHSIAVYQNTKSDELGHKVNVIISKIDDLVLKDLRAANILLTDLGSQSENNHLISKAENLFLNNIGLNPLLKTGGIQNTYIIALSYLGLFRVGIIKNYDPEILTKYALRMFQTGENFVRADIFPNVYSECFKPKCIDIFQCHAKRKDNLATPSDYAKTTIIRASQAGIGIGALILATGCTALKVHSGTIVHGSKQMISEMEKAIPNSEYFITANEIDKQCEMEIDRRCAQIAEHVLDSLNGLAAI